MHEKPGPVFFYPADWFTNLEDPNSRKRFMDLMQFQYDFTEEESEGMIDNLRKELYWQKKVPRVLALVANQNHERAFQLGTLLGYHSEKFWVTFGDTILEPLNEEDLLVIEKSDISPQAGIRVRFLDDKWEKVIQEGELTSYQENTDSKKGEPFGWYIVEVEGKTQKIEDWTMLGGKTYRFFLEPTEDN